MSLSRDLLEQADHLSRRETRRPRQASLRRSTSASYYSVFHLLCAEFASSLAPHAELRTKARLQRYLNHSDMRTACERFLQVPLSRSLGALMTAPPSPDLRVVAQAFVQLQRARHEADYDMQADWTRAKARSYLELARNACSAWEHVRRTAEADIFLLSLILLKQFDVERS